MMLIPRIRNSTWAPRWFNLAVLIFLITIHVRLYPYAFDDAYIHFRVARNLFEIGSPYFNVNDALKVSTSSGWIVFITLLFGVLKNLNMENYFPLLISVTNAFILVGILYIYEKIVENLLNSQFTLTQKLLFSTLVVAILLPSSIGLMETPFALLVAGLGIYLLLLSNPFGISMLGFAAYLRLELSILVVMICIFAFFRKQFRIHQIIGYGVLGVIPLICFDLYYFHTIVPHSIIAKSIVYPFPPIRTLLQILSLSLPAIPILKTQAWFISTCVTLFIVIIVMTGWMVLRERKILKNYLPPLLFFSGLFIIAMYILGHALLFDWYIPLYMFPISVACFTYYSSIGHPRNIPLKIILSIMFLLSATFLISTSWAAIDEPDFFSLFESGSRVKSYLTIGKIINEDYPNSRLLTSEIGGLGYSFKGQILDAAGLASSEALAFHPMEFSEERSNNTIGTIPPGYVKLTKPEIIVSYDSFSQALLRDEISDQYNIIAIPAYLPEDALFSNSKTIWGSKYLRVFILKSLPVSKKLCAMAIKSNEIPNNACGT